MVEAKRFDQRRSCFKLSGKLGAGPDHIAETTNLRSVLLGVAALGLTAVAAWSQANFSCSDAYKRALDGMEQRKLPPERLAVQRRQAMRAYHACVSGDVNDPKGLFDRLDRSGQ